MGNRAVIAVSFLKTFKKTTALTKVRLDFESLFEVLIVYSGARLSSFHLI